MISFTFTEIEKEYLDPDNNPLPFVLCTMGEYGEQNNVYRPHGFQFHHILWVTKGKGTVNINGEEHELCEGEGFFCKRNVPHSYKRNGAVFSTAWITFLCTDGALDYFKLPDGFCFNVTPSLKNMTDELKQICSNGSTVIERSATGYHRFCEWLSDITSERIPLYRKIRRYLESNFSKQLTLADIAKFAGTDRYAVCHYYKSARGITVMEELKKIRIAKAKHLLRYTQYSAKQICYMCGFDNASYFGMVFKSETGLTPIEYREKQNED